MRARYSVNEGFGKDFEGNPVKSLVAQPLDSPIAL